jgi:aminomethyltransferase
MTTTATTSAHEPRKTPLFAAHQELGAKMVDFGGWMMPLQYSGILDEHHATRNAVGLFDVSHMGEVVFSGPGATDAVNWLVTGDVAALPEGRALYTLACRPDGGIVDDIIVYRQSPDRLMMVVNAANTAKDLAWFRENVGSRCEIRDLSGDTALLAFQGPKAADCLASRISRGDVARMKSFDFVADAELAGIPVSLARTGYTAEDGFELFCAASDARKVWDLLLDAARAVLGRPVGLGARDTLRLEGRLSLYGNDLSEQTSPLEAGLDRFVKLDGADFIGREALLAQRAAGIRRKLAGFVMRGRGVARHGYPICSAGGERIGEVTSGAPGPTVGQNIGLGYVPAQLAEPGTKLLIDCRGKLVEAEVVRGPFYRRPK